MKCAFASLSLPALPLHQILTPTFPKPNNNAHNDTTVDYRNNRAAYVEAYWSLVNWQFANEQLAKAP